MNQLKDKELLSLIQSGQLQQQDRVFRYFYQHYYGMIENFILKNSGEASDVADIFQEAIIVFFNQSKEKGFTIASSIKTYFYAICRNRWLMKLRAAKKERPILNMEHIEVEVSDTAFETLEQTEKKQLIVKLLRELGKECKQIIELYYYRKMKMVDIQSVFNYASEQVAKNKKSRCMKQLRTKIFENVSYKELLHS